MSDESIIELPESDRVYLQSAEDKSLYYMLKDASNGDTGFRFVGANIFRPEENHPKPDKLIKPGCTGKYNCTCEYCKLLR